MQYFRYDIPGTSISVKTQPEVSNTRKRRTGSAEFLDIILPSMLSFISPVSLTGCSKLQLQYKQANPTWQGLLKTVTFTEEFRFMKTDVEIITEFCRQFIVDFFFQKYMSKSK